MSCEQRFAGAEAIPAPIHRLGDKATMPKHIFFSYSHDRNKELVMMLKAALEKRGHTVWFDAKDIGTWDDWKGRITRGIDGSEMAIAFMSSHALRDPGVCRNEIAISLNRFGCIYPVVVEPNIYDDIPLTIRHLQWPDLSLWQDIRDGRFPAQDWSRWYEGHLLDLIEKIEGEATHFAGESKVLRDVLSPSSFEAKLAQHVPGFVGRDWVFDAYEHWLNEQPQSRLFWLKWSMSTILTARRQLSWPVEAGNKFDDLCGRASLSHRRGMPRLCGATAVALHVHLQNGRVMHQPVDGGQRHSRLHKHLAPLRERRVGGDGQTLALIPLGYQLEQD